jgi:dTMP kinase
MAFTVGKGFFITFEGPEGGGKSTHIRLLADFLRRRRFRVLVTREPGGTQMAHALRQILLESGDRLSALAELFLYEADRAQHVAEFIGPALRKGNIVLCDRFTDSTVAYQGNGRGLDKKIIRILNDVASQGVKPNLTILLDVPVERGLRLAAKRNKGHDRLERAGLAFHRRVRQGFLRRARQEPHRFRVIRQRRTIGETQHLIREAIRSVVVPSIR